VTSAPEASGPATTTTEPARSPGEPAPVAGYRPLPGVYDEMIGADGRPREPWAHVGRMIDGLGVTELNRRRAEAARLLANDGVEYQLHRALSSEPGPDTQDPERRWDLDPVPVVLDSGQWAELERGVIQRAELLSLILADLYSQRRLVKAGLVPPELLFDHPGFLREADQISIPGSQLPTCAIDVARDATGTWWALTDRAQTPSGFGYALENRVVLSRVFPSTYRDAQVHRLAPFFRSLRAALRAAAPSGTDEPRIVVLSPGPWSGTAFEHAFLASYLGYQLVEGADLTVRDGRVWLRSLGQLEPVDVILRRVDSSYCDPLELRSESLLGVPGLVEAARSGRVSIVNPLGSGVLENPSLLALLPRLCQHMLGQELRLPSVPTWWCGDPDGAGHVLANLDRLVIKSTSREAGGYTRLGWELGAAERAELRARIEAAPYGWVGQEPLDLSTVPATGERGLQAQHMLMRTFLVARGESYAAMPGALARIAPAARGALIARHGRSDGADPRAARVYKDVWVAASEPEELTGFWLRPDRADAATGREPAPTARAAENLFWLGRYAERAEALVRLLRVVEDRRNDFADGMNPAGNACLAALLAALGQVSGTDLSGPEVDVRLGELVTDPERPGSLAFAVRRLRDTAYPVRDQLSGDTWLLLGALERELLDPVLTGTAPGRLARVLTSLLALGGLTSESMVHDLGWRFMTAGRRLERALQMLTLLRSTVTVEHDTATDSLLLESVLTVAESVITYRRRHRSRAQLDTVLDLLLFDPQNPRSVAYQLERLQQTVRTLASRDPGVVSGGARLSEGERVVLQSTTALQLADPATLIEVSGGPGRPQLAAFLDLLISQLRHSGEVVDAEHFTHLLPQRRLPTPADADHSTHLRLV
jgi:uncharacterized circularly permuted ATP-grasp superfamily protein/uncharacterized alpha-E superfamily protein